MKKIITLIALSIICNKSFSQSAYKSDLQPVVGEDYIKHVVDNASALDPGLPGVGQTWDLSNANFSLQNDYYYFIVDPTSTPYIVPSASYVQKNYASWDTTYVGYEYFKDTTDGYYALHEYGNILEINYPSYEFIWKFPLVYGDSTMSTFEFSSTAFGTTYDYTATSKLSLDGAGTLLTGSVPIQNVMRFKYEEMTIRQSPNDTTYITKYFWYLAGIHHPIADYTAILDPNGTTYYSASLYSMSNTTGVRTADLNPAIKFYQDRDNNLINVKAESDIDKIVLFDIQGKLLIEKNNGLQQNYTLSTAQLGSGMYILSVTSGGRSNQWKFVKD